MRTVTIYVVASGFEYGADGDEKNGPKPVVTLKITRFAGKCMDG